MKRAQSTARSVVRLFAKLAAIVQRMLATSRRTDHCASGALTRVTGHCSPTGLLSLSVLIAVAGCGGGGSGGAGGDGGTTPPPPTNQSPANVRLIEASSPVVGQLSTSWLPASDDSTPPASLRYQIHASTELGFSPTASTLRLETSGQLSGLVTSGLEPGRRYYVRLAVVDAQGASAVSEALSVTVADTAASRVPGTTVRVLEGPQVVSITERSIRLAAGVPAPLVGTYLASGDGAGYLRRITGVSTEGDQQVLATERAALSEVIGDFQVSSAVRMAALPDPATSGLREKARISRTSSSQPRLTLTWPDSGFAYSAGAEQAPVAARRKVSTQGRMDSSSLRFEVGPTQTSTGDWAVLRGPTRIGLEEGGSGEALLWAETTSEKEPRFGRQVSICKFEFGSITSEAPGAAPRDVGVALSGPIERTTVIPFPEGDRVTKAQQAFEITAVPGTASAYPYKVKAYLYLEDMDRNCLPPKPGEILTRPLGGWREIIELEATIYVGNDAFPSEERVVKEYEGTVEATAGADARFSVTNDVVVTFDPLVSYDIRLGPVGKGLEHVRIAVEASPMVEQTLTVEADAKGTIDAEAPLISPRKFYKLFIAAGGVPVVVSGEFTVQAKIAGNVTGALQATEKLQIGFDRLVYGVECSGHMDCKPIEERHPVANLKVGGEGAATADLTITLVPSLTVSLYESLNGRITLDPYLRADAALEGRVELDAAIDPDDGMSDRAFDADYRLTKASLKAGMTAYVYGDFTVLDKTWAAWPDGAISDNFRTHRALPLAEAVVAALPQLSAAVDMTALHPADIAAIRIATEAGNWPNPWAAVFRGAPESLVTWRRWTSPKIKAPLGVFAESYGFLEPSSIDADEVWVVFDEPGTYVVRMGGFSSWGTWARQYVDVEVTVTDANNNAVLDHVEARKGAVAIAIDSVGCTVPIVGSVMVCTITGSSLPETTEFLATNCLPARMEALPDGFEDSRRYGCTPAVAGLPVEVAYSVPGFVGMAPTIPALAAVDGPDEPAASTVLVSVSSSGTQGDGSSQHPSISSDGRHVAFLSRARTLSDDKTTSLFLADLFIHDRQSKTTERVSIAGNSYLEVSGGPVKISRDGRFIAFASYRSLAPGGVFSLSDLFVFDRHTETVKLVNVRSDGFASNDLGYDSDDVDISDDGRYAVFDSYDSATVANDTNGSTDVFVRDLLLNVTERVSVATDGSEADRGASGSRISADGRYVAFASASANLVPGDSNEGSDVFVYDRLKRTTERVSVSSAGAQTMSRATMSDIGISANGQYIVFASSASDLVPNDTNGRSDIFLRDRVNGVTTRVSVSTAGLQGDGASAAPTISADGRFVAFASYSSNLVPDDTNRAMDAFVYDTLKGTTERVNVSSAGGEGNAGLGNSFGETSLGISADGRTIAFWSGSTNLVDGDTNGFEDVFVRDRGAAALGP